MKCHEQHGCDLLPSVLKGFTLIELLVAISITAIIITILLPVVRKSRESAQAVRCASNLHQLGITFHNYGVDNDDWLPHIGLAAGGIPHVGEWYKFYYPYLSNTQLASTNPNDVGLANPVFDCPTTPTDVKPFDYYSGYAAGSSNGLNGKKIYELRHDTILLIDHDAAITWWSWQSSPQSGGLFWNVYYPGWATPFSPYLPGYHHDNGANILFSGGHVRHYSRSDYQPDWKSDNYWMKEYISQ